ncbi:alpha/beta hydrolase [Shimia ponticola]|uniref:alpha/beta hydrolase n=1 Tax=Shimia ponticola TaxID=2582893 RepID=UPI002106086C|nr:alpha/beta hydrolase [Shimia ponticola]
MTPTVQTPDHYHALTTTPETGKPLLFALHGTGGDERQFFDLAQSIVPGAGVVSPRGDVSEMGAARFFRRTGEGVYDMADLARATDKIADYVAAHKAAHPDIPVYGFGYSNGANILAAVTMARPDLFDRVGLLHPLIPWTPDSMDLDGKRVLITGGHRDPIAPLPATEALIAWYTAQGAAVTQSLHPGGHELQQSEIAALAELLNG